MADKYVEKRDFSKTPEPTGKTAPKNDGPLTFVVQKHAARRLHYDFRLELDGVLKSWAIPKGPSTDPKVKRMATMVEDHPLDYASFEGVIPQGNYGGGQVIVWDHGTFSPDEDGLLFDDRKKAQDAIREGLAKGKLSMTMRGHKMKGSWALVKMQKTKNDWLLIKHNDFAAGGADLLIQESSVISGLTIADLKAGKLPVKATLETLLAGLPGARQAPFPPSVAPMLAEQSKAPFSDPKWLFEPKLDGYRTIALVQNGGVRLLSRNGLDVSGNYPYVIEGLLRQPVAELVLDGEIVALDEQGRACFQCLQNYAQKMQRTVASETQPPIIYYVFDILFLDGFDLRDVSLEQRKQLLDTALVRSERVRTVDYYEGSGETVYQAAIDSGLEGVIAKSKNSRYESGRRSADWLKIKNMTSDDFVIGGFTAGTGNRADSFGALLIGRFNDGGKLVFAGHVGSGFDERLLADLRRRLDEIQSDVCPFSETPPQNAPATWVQPELVAEIKYSQITDEGYLRTPVFLHLREDKTASDVRSARTVIVVSNASSATTVIGDNPLLTEILSQLRQNVTSLSLRVEEHRISLTNLDKELWPATETQRALTKRDFITYLVQLSPCILPQLRDRPLTLTRFPHGVFGEHFYQKHIDTATPGFVQKVALREHDGELRDYLLCNDLATLLWLGQLADIELHTWFSRIRPDPDRQDLADSQNSEELARRMTEYPDFIIFDLDPYLYSGAEAAGAEPELNRAAFDKTCEAALWLKTVLDGLGLGSFVKTSGKTGLHIHVPIVRQFDYLAVRSAAETICKFVWQQHQQDITIDWTVEKRRGKVFLDYNQNVMGKTLAAAYSPRPTPQATVSTPLRWEEVGKVYPTGFTILSLPERVAQVGDLWANILQAKHDLSALIKGK